MKMENWKSRDKIGKSYYLLSFANNYLKLLIELLYPSKRKHQRRPPIAQHHIYEHVRSTAAELPKTTLTRVSGWYCGQYKYEPLKGLVWAVKYDNNSEAVSLCAHLLADELVARLTDCISPMEGKLMLTAVPSTAYSLRERAVDHMQEIAIALKPLLINFILPNSSPDLLSISPEAAQSLLQQSKTSNRAARIIHARGKFEVKKHINEKGVILIDDVVTTGATMRDCARALQTAGATHIYCVSLTH
ncbi:MAG: phosphoribosyltransferase family protein [Patescibacteria group bacterium]